MSDNILEYNGFRAGVDFSADDDLLVGRILDIDALILFSAETPKEVRHAFQEAVDEYVEDCKRRNVEPEKPCKGTFNVRVGSELHRQAAFAARQAHESLNAFVTRAMWMELGRQRSVISSVNAIRWHVTKNVAIDQDWADASPSDPDLTSILAVDPLKHVELLN